MKTREREIDNKGTVSNTEMLQQQEETIHGRAEITKDEITEWNDCHQNDETFMHKISEQTVSENCVYVNHTGRV